VARPKADLIRRGPTTLRRGRIVGLQTSSIRRSSRQTLPKSPLSGHGRERPSGHALLIEPRLVSQHGVDAAKQHTATTMRAIFGPRFSRTRSYVALYLGTRRAQNVASIPGVHATPLPESTRSDRTNPDFTHAVSGLEPNRGRLPLRTEPVSGVSNRGGRLRIGPRPLRDSIPADSMTKQPAKRKAGLGSQQTLCWRVRWGTIVSPVCPRRAGSEGGPDVRHESRQHVGITRAWVDARWRSCNTGRRIRHRIGRGLASGRRDGTGSLLA